MNRTGQNLYELAKKRIPGGTQLLTKRPEMFLPEQWPSYYSKAQGAEVWDLDHNHFIDMSYNGIGACVLGHADPDVNAAVHAAVDAGSMSTLNCPEEVELADLLCDIHPWADMVRYARSGGEAMAIAVRIARAHTGRDKVAICGYHGWHDWYLATNLASNSHLDGHMLPGLNPHGVPRGLVQTALPFHYNKIDELEAIVAGHGDQLAAIVMEPLRSEEPVPGFLEGVRAIADRAGAVLIFDEITVGFRLNCGGVHLLDDIQPDIAVFAKAIGNGYPMSAVIGTENVMQAAQAAFISSTSWTERIGPSAALATIRKFQNNDVAKHLIKVGTRVQEIWRSAAGDADLPIHISGIPPLAHIGFEGRDPLMIRTLFTQLMLERGFLSTSAFYATYAHQDGHLNDYDLAIQDVFGVLAKAISENNVQALLSGPIAHSGFQRLT